MATKYLKMNRSLKTRIGLLRFGITYSLDDSEKRVADVIKATTDKGTKDKPKIPAGVLLTKKKVDEERSAVESLVPIEEPISLSGDVAQNLSDALEAIERLKKANVELTEADAGKAKQIEALTEQVADLEKAMEDLAAAHEDAANAAKTAMEEADDALAKAAEEINDLNSALEAAKKEAE